MIIYGDYHTHTTYSHGKGSILDNAISAKQKGLKELAITDHGFSHRIYNVKRSDIENVITDCQKAEQATGVNILLGIEENLLSLDGKIGVLKRDLDFLDIVNVGYHKMARSVSARDAIELFMPNNLKFYTKRQIEKNTICLLKALETQPINILTHINYGMPVNVEEVAKSARQKGVFIELNGKRVCFSPADMEALLKHDTQFILNSDAHSPERVGDVRNGMRYVVKYDIPEKNIVNLGKKPVFKDLKKFN